MEAVDDLFHVEHKKKPPREITVGRDELLAELAKAEREGRVIWALEYHFKSGDVTIEFMK